MIYQTLKSSDPLSQGDIFVNVPRIDFSMNEILVADEEGELESSWGATLSSDKPLNAIVPITPITAIVITPDCDALRNPNITLCEIRSFREVEKKCSQTQSPKKWVDIITQQARINQKWYYLPPDASIGFEDKMAADFLVTIRLRREDLELNRSLRVGRLNATAKAHFRQRIGDFFARAPFDEWYSLNKEEFKHYKDGHPGTIPFKWQESD